VNNALYAYINDLKLGAAVEEFDLDREIAKITGVDNFTWTQLSIKDGTGVSDIATAPYQYPRVDLSDLVITLV
jgi:hypothetical protein